MKKWYAIIGAIPFDDEDSVYIYEAATEEEAKERFEKDIYQDALREDQKQVEKETGVSVYINQVLESDTEIRVA